MMALFDFFGIIFFLLLTSVFYKKGWFFSFYSFIKFIFIAAISFVAGLIASTVNPYSYILTKLQFMLLIEGLTFAALWMSLSFEKFFFPIMRVISLNRFIFTNRIDRFLNIIPSAAASLFICFFVFTILVSLSTRSVTLAHSIEESNVVKPVAYRIYNADLPLLRERLFEGVAFKLVPDVANQPTQLPVPSEQTPIAEASPTLAPSTFVPPTQAPAPTNPPLAPRAPIIFPTSVPTQTPQAPTPGITYIPTPTQYTPQKQTTVPVVPIQPPQINASQAEQDIFRLTNQKRAENGLPALVFSDALSQVARSHSQDMSSRNFFNHVNPDGKDPFARMQIAGIAYTTAAENIAAGPTADIIVTNWMSSEGHRKNILNPAFGTIGIGVAVDPKYGLMATQTFTN